MNCNACLKLERVRREKCKDGFLYGKCDSLECMPYPRTNGLIKFHPSDWMGMPCFINRDTGIPSDLKIDGDDPWHVNE
ncbi:MAG: hypothetical protein ACUZ8H_03825 [Candidatus Anammoxibacter sp.]